jgi:hypothetical protein
MCFSWQVETFLHDTDIQKRQAQQRRGLSWGGYIIYYLQFRSALNCWFIELCTTTWRIWYLLINMALCRTDRRWRTCWSTLFLCWIQLKKDGRWIPFSVYTNFSKAFYRVRYQLLLRRCLWVSNPLDVYG